MGRFSRKHGGEHKEPLRHDEMPRSLRHHLWTIVYDALTSYSHGETLFASSDNAPEKAFMDGFFTEIMDVPVSMRPQGWNPASIQGWFYADASWAQVYDAVDYIASAAPEATRARLGIEPTANGYAARFNKVLERELSPWRFVGDELVLVSSPGEQEAVEDSLKNAPDLVGRHIRAALLNLSQRPEANVRGAIAESVHAFESMAKHVLETKNGTYPALAQSLEKKGLHPLFIRAFKDLYNRESDEGGTRHGFKPGEDPTKHLAEGRFYVVLTSAFVNYMLEFYAAPPSKQKPGR